MDTYLVEQSPEQHRTSETEEEDKQLPVLAGSSKPKNCSKSLKRQIALGGRRCSVPVQHYGEAVRQSLPNSIPGIPLNSNCDLERRLSIVRKKHLWKCDVCQESFSQKSYLTRHSLVHTGERPWECDVCQKSFALKSNLTKHSLLHTGERPWKCDVCQKSFAQKSDLTRHSLVHTGERPWKCDVCLKSFALKSNLTKHSLVHTGERPWKCELCQSSFARKSHLTTHSLVHTGKRPWKCDVCQKSFERKSHLTRHACSHAEERPSKLDTRQKLFLLKSDLSKLVRTHKKDRSSNSDLCEDIFPQESPLFSPLQRSSVEQALPSSCGVSYPGSPKDSDLSDQEPPQEEEKSLECNWCDQTFVLQYDLISHLLTHIRKRRVEK